MVYKKEYGFTLLEIMLVVVILSMLAAVAVPRLAASSESAREKADITTGREVKSALDRYQVETGLYPRLGELQAVNGEVKGNFFIPVYIKKLDASVTQQNAEEEKRGFDIAEWSSSGNHNLVPSHLIMILLTIDGSAAEVKVYDRTLSRLIWSSI